MAKKTLSDVRAEPGMSNAGKYKGLPKGDFAGPKGTFPINSESRARNALARSHFAQHPDAVRAKVLKKYPDLKAGSKFSSTGKPKKTS
jgi:hypothetical protein